MGLEALLDIKSSDSVWLNRTHRFVLTYAVLMTEAFFVSKDICGDSDQNRKKDEPKLNKAISISNVDEAINQRSRTQMVQKQKAMTN